MFGTIYLHVKKQLNVLFNVNSNMSTYVTNSVITLHAPHILPKRYAFMLHNQQCAVLHGKFSAQNTCLTTPHLTMYTLCAYLYTGKCDYV